MHRDSRFICILSGFLLATAVVSAETTDYTYDAAGRLSRADYDSGASIVYSYDANGNMVARNTSNGTHVTLIYRATFGGWILGMGTQTVVLGASGAPVAAVPHPYFQFVEWSDGLNTATRTDVNRTANLSVTAQFAAILAARGTPQWWLASHGYTSNFDAAELRDDDNDTIPAWKEFIADTNPTNAASFLHVQGLGTGMAIHFESSTSRLYTLHRIVDPAGGEWSRVPGAGPRAGVGGPDMLTDTNQPDLHHLYRIAVEIP